MGRVYLYLIVLLIEACIKLAIIPVCSTIDVSILGTYLIFNVEQGQAIAVKHMGHSLSKRGGYK